MAAVVVGVGKKQKDISFTGGRIERKVHKAAEVDWGSRSRHDNRPRCPLSVGLSIRLFVN